MSNSLSDSLEALYQQEIKLGYIEPDRLSENKYYELKDSHYNITFKAQINYLRDSYINDMSKQQSKPGIDCPICYDNIYEPGKEKLRVHPFNLANREFFAQYTPYPLFPYHTVLITREHYPMCIDQQVVTDLLTFIKQAPDYTCCSNSDVQWAGASILQHHHYQVFKDLQLPIQTARSEFDHISKDFNLELLHYPIACARVSSNNAQRIEDIGGKIIQFWKEQRQNNTCNLLLDHCNNQYNLYILFRHPDYRTPIPIQKVKSEGIGVVEVCGYGIYPVPHGDNAKFIWDKIDNDGLNVIKTLIAGNNPIADEQRFDFWHQLCTAAACK